jgi:uncharacterized Zn-finger protein
MSKNNKRSISCGVHSRSKSTHPMSTQAIKRKRQPATLCVCAHPGCAYTTRHTGHFVTHQRTHSGEKPYKCTQCSFACSESGHLVVHQRTHSNKKPYKCTQCSFACKRSGDLVTHHRTHSGEKPYKCNQCSYPVQRRDLS